MAESMTIGDLAARVNMTPRNIRAYQSRGLLFPPEIRGRVAHYSGAHAARLLLIASLQREGFTLSAIQKLLDSPDSYSAIVADRRRRFREGSSDIDPTDPIPEERIHEVLPDLPADLTETGLAWRDEDGQLVSHTVLVAVGRMLASSGVPLEIVAQLQLDAAASAASLGELLRATLDRRGTGGSEVADLAKVAVQLSATAFEIAFVAAATRGLTAGPQLPQ
jgi:DNA-binding transcriptional MerR regulator